MIIECYRCRKPIDTPNASNADYVVGVDTGDKTAIVCTGCWRDDDTVIWGKHKDYTGEPVGKKSNRFIEWLKKVLP